VVSIPACHAEGPARSQFPAAVLFVRIGHMGGMRLQCLLWPFHVMTRGPREIDACVGFWNADQVFHF
jgi:hypothetical protein